MKSKQKTEPPSRVVFEVVVGSQRHQIEAGKVDELREKLRPLWPDYDEFSLRAVAHLALVRRVSINDGQYRISRIGVMSFQRDSDPLDSPRKEPQRRPKGELPAAPLTHNGQQESESLWPIAAAAGGHSGT